MAMMSHDMKSHIPACLQPFLTSKKTCSDFLTHMGPIRVIKAFFSYMKVCQRKKRKTENEKNKK
jgi:hypothetical protein